MRQIATKQSWLLILTGTYCVISVMMNYLCMKPLNFGTGIVWMDGGLLISWIVFLISNVIVEAYDKKTAILVSGIATVLTLAISFLGVAEVKMPTLPQYAAQAEHFAHIFSNGPRTILSSAIAFFAGNWVNVSVIARLKQSAHRFTDSPLPQFPNSFWLRAVISTIIGQIVDNSLFQVLAFAPVGLSVYEMFWHDIWTAVGVSSLFETVVEALFVPLITLPLTKYIQNLEYSN
ncbi:MAG: queuosine precursor transporter [Paludibacteraceae bacterium]|nr:queuosine precursor transporter [Paludibacteraceae bacterium]